MGKWDDFGKRDDFHAPTGLLVPGLVREGPEGLYLAKLHPATRALTGHGYP